jgi:hypothetical protein
VFEPRLTCLENANQNKDPASEENN